MFNNDSIAIARNPMTSRFFFWVLVTRIGTDCFIVWMGIMGFEGMAGVPPASWSRPHLLA